MAKRTVRKPAIPDVSEPDENPTDEAKPELVDRSEPTTEPIAAGSKPEPLDPTRLGNFRDHSDDREEETEAVVADLIEKEKGRPPAQQRDNGALADAAAVIVARMYSGPGLLPAVLIATSPTTGATLCVFTLDGPVMRGGVCLHPLNPKCWFPS